MSDILFLCRTRSAAVKEAIRMAKVGATRDMESCSVGLCVGACGHRDTYDCCMFCEHIQVDPVGRVTREAIQ